ncbi:hypothetical protein PMEL1_00284 [Prevotella melaninogenica]|uniref:Uncharacterized protein n=1 Tax=Prevotella melaninogenica TaxID=28132 RepID=A0A250KFF0_9BACT|nr:hypothetical protein PMEL1_00284 [Prevotella melaninogenica]
MSLSIVYYANIVFIFYSSFISAKFFTTCRYLYNDRCLFNILHYYVSIFFVNLLTTYKKTKQQHPERMLLLFVYSIISLIITEDLLFCYRTDTATSSTCNIHKRSYVIFLNCKTSSSSSTISDTIPINTFTTDSEQITCAKGA